MVLYGTDINKHIVAGFFGFGIGMLITFYTMKKKNEKK